jgi:hypothetical protein
MNRSLEISTTIGCPINCSTCPQAAILRAYRGREPREMAMENFRAVLDHTPSSVEISFAGVSEPFLNPRCLDMVEMASGRGHDVSIATTLVGLTPDGIDRLSGTRLIFFLLHTADPYGIAHIPDNDNYRRTLDRAYRKLEVTFLPEVSQHGTKYFRNNYRAGSVTGAPRLKVYGPISCCHLSEARFMCFPDGTVVLCCMDWEFRHVLGNIYAQTFDEIMEGEAFQKIRRARLHLWGSELCRSCTEGLTFDRGLRIAWRKIKGVYGRYDFRTDA